MREGKEKIEEKEEQVVERGSGTDIWERLQRIDRRWIFLIVAVAVAVPILVPLNLPVYVTRDVRGVFDAIEALPARAPVLVAFDYEPGSTPECDPLAMAILRHCFRRDLRVVGVTILPVGVGTGESVLKRAATEFNRQEGVDYTFLPFVAEGFAPVVGFGVSLQATFEQDRYGNDTRIVPVLAGVRRLADFAYVAIVHDDSTINTWVIYGQEPYRLRMGAACTAVMAPGNYPYLHAGQLTGIVGALKGASEYENLLGRRDQASRGMDTQTVIHVVVIGFMVLGNVGYAMSRRKGGS